MSGGVKKIKNAGISMKKKLAQLEEASRKKEASEKKESAVKDDKKKTDSPALPVVYEEVCEDALVVKSNNLAQAEYFFDLIEQRVLLLAITELRRKKTIDSKEEITIHASDYAYWFKTNKNSAYNILRKAAENIYEEEFHYTKWTNNKLERGRARWVQNCSYIERDASIRLRFSEEVMPLISGMVGNFSQYELRQVRYLTSGYALRLYELAASEAWKNKDIPKMSIEELRAKLGVKEDLYKDFSSFNRAVIQRSVKQINDQSNYNLTPVYHRKGRRVESISFEIDEKVFDIQHVALSKKSSEEERLKKILKDKERIKVGNRVVILKDEMHLLAKVGEGTKEFLSRVGKSVYVDLKGEYSSPYKK